MQGKPRNQEQSIRMDIIARELGCECCHIDKTSIHQLKSPKWTVEPCQIHHVDKKYKYLPIAQKGQDHNHVFGLCPWHHLGEGKPKWIGSRHSGERPKIAPHLKQRKAFRHRYGTQKDLEVRCRLRYRVLQQDTVGGFGRNWPGLDDLFESFKAENREPLCLQNTKHDHQSQDNTQNNK